MILDVSKKRVSSWRREPPTEQPGGILNVQFPSLIKHCACAITHFATQCYHLTVHLECCCCCCCCCCCNVNYRKKRETKWNTEMNVFQNAKSGFKTHSVVTTSKQIPTCHLQQRHTYFKKCYSNVRFYTSAAMYLVFVLLGCCAVQICSWLPTFQNNLSLMSYSVKQFDCLTDRLSWNVGNQPPSYSL